MPESRLVARPSTLVVEKKKDEMEIVGIGLCSLRKSQLVQLPHLWQSFFGISVSFYLFNLAASEAND